MTLLKEVVVVKCYHPSPTEESKSQCRYLCKLCTNNVSQQPQHLEALGNTQITIYTRVSMCPNFTLLNVLDGLGIQGCW